MLACGMPDFTALYIAIGVVGIGWASLLLLGMYEVTVAEKNRGLWWAFTMAHLVCDIALFGGLR